MQVCSCGPLPRAPPRGTAHLAEAVGARAAGDQHFLFGICSQFWLCLKWARHAKMVIEAACWPIALSGEAYSDQLLCMEE